MRTLLLVLLLTGCATPLTTVVVVRHAEKAKDGTKDPALTRFGAARAKHLAQLLGKTKPAAVFATQYKRTQDTVRPLCEKTSVRLRTVPADASGDLAKEILQSFRGDTVVVAGHSNTVNRLIAELGGPSMSDLDHDDYDNLFMLTIAGTRTKLVTLQMGLTSTTAH